MNRKYLNFWIENFIGSEYFLRNNEISEDLKPYIKFYENL